MIKMILCSLFIIMATGCAHTNKKSIERKTASFIPNDSEPMDRFPEQTILTLKKGFSLNLEVEESDPRIYIEPQSTNMFRVARTFSLPEDKTCFMQFSTEDKNLIFEKNDDVLLQFYISNKTILEDDFLYFYLEKVGGGISKLKSIGCTLNAEIDSSHKGTIEVLKYYFGRFFDFEYPKPEEFSEKINPKLNEEKLIGEERSV